MIKPTPLFVLPLALLIAACTNDPLLPTHQLEVGATGLPQLSDDAYYQLWVSVPTSGKRSGAEGVSHDDAAYLSVGRFRINSTGRIEALDGGVATFAVPDDADPALLADALLTVERGQAATTPGHRMLSGVFTGSQSLGRATLRLNGGDAFGTAIGGDSSINAAGSYTLETPTTDSIDDYPLGIWFVRFVAGGPIEPSLNLPVLPLQDAENPDWIYETFLVRRQNTSLPEEFISLGTFTSATAPDANGPGPHAGPRTESAYAVPGEDFVADGATRLLEDGTYRVVVALQPKGLGLARPVVTLLQTDAIPSPVSYRQADTLLGPATLPTVTLRIER